MKVRGYVVENMLHEISRNDQLTQMNNRNAYELDRDSIPNIAKHKLGCVYIDVNDLKFINDTRGHDQGDEMLRYVSMMIVKLFGKEYSYRIGGDEFIAFIPDPQDLEIRIREFTQSLEEEGYHAAIGSSICKVRDIDLEKLVTNAEVIMYREKKYYHEKHNRRRRGD